MASSKITTILIGTTNEGKFQMYKDMLSFLNDNTYIIQKLSKNESDYLIVEDFEKLENNAILKAKTYAEISGHITVADDTGFFIPALNNEPGIAVRRWGGLFPDNINDQEWEKYFLKRIKQCEINEPSCLKRQVIVCAHPNGKHILIEQQYVGKIKIPGAGHYLKGAPLSSYFFFEQCQRFDADLTEEDKDVLYGGLKIKLFDAISELDLPENK